MPDARLLDRISIVLVEPKEPGNVGAAARAMKTMGLSSLALVGGPDLSDPSARQMGHGAHAILEAAHRTDTLAEALAPCRLALATTHRRRRNAPPLHPLEEAIPELMSAARAGQVALVFGREDRGLTAAEIALCAGLCRLPAATAHPSLNLAQAVMVFCWELAQAVRFEGGGRQQGGIRVAPRPPGATLAERSGLLEEWRTRLSGARGGVREEPRLLASLQALLQSDALTRAQLGTLRRFIRTLDRGGGTRGDQRE